MTPSEILKTLENNIKVSGEAVDFGKALERLYNNKDFKRVIVEGYFKDEPIRLVQLLSAVDMQTPDKQQSIMQQMVGIGQLQQYFNVIKFHARQGQKSIEECEDLREEILTEGDAE